MTAAAFEGVCVPKGGMNGSDIREVGGGGGLKMGHVMETFGKIGKVREGKEEIVSLV
jgi:hypothetical protein